MKRLTIARGAKYDWMPFPLQSIDSLHFTRNSSTFTQCERHCKYDIQLKLKRSQYFRLKKGISVTKSHFELVRFFFALARAGFYFHVVNTFLYCSHWALSNGLSSFNQTLDTAVQHSTKWKWLKEMKWNVNHAKQFVTRVNRRKVFRFDNNFMLQQQRALRLMDRTAITIKAYTHSKLCVRC